jgi:hypothetical protein
LTNGLDRAEVLSPDWEPLQRLRVNELLHHEVDAVAAGSFRRLKPPAIKGSGYVVKSLEAALWAFHDAQDFPEAVLKAVNLGDDAGREKQRQIDTVADAVREKCGSSELSRGLLHDARHRPAPRPAERDKSFSVR